MRRRSSTLDEAEQLFYDDTIRVAADLVPTLLKVKVADPWVVRGPADPGRLGLPGIAADSAAAAYFNVVMHNILKLTFRDELPADLWPARRRPVVRGGGRPARPAAQPVVGRHRRPRTWSRPGTTSCSQR